MELLLLHIKRKQMKWSSVTQHASWMTCFGYALLGGEITSLDRFGNASVCLFLDLFDFRLHLYLGKRDR